MWVCLVSYCKTAQKQRVKGRELLRGSCNQCSYVCGNSCVKGKASDLRLLALTMALSLNLNFKGMCNSCNKYCHTRRDWPPSTRSGGAEDWEG